MTKYSLLLFGELIFLSQSLTIDDLRSYPVCKLGRLQSPLELKTSKSEYSSDFSFVYQNYKLATGILNKFGDKFLNINNEKNGGFVTFEKEGVLKQYHFVRAELYRGVHKIDGVTPDWELHLIHEKDLGFVTNKNQYKSIQDANQYLSIVLRYTKGNNGMSDNGLLSTVIQTNGINLGDYPIFQDKRAFLYEGSFMYTPCDENVNYYVIKDLFTIDDTIKTSLNEDTELFTDKVPLAERFDRPIYRNFMNYKEYSLSIKFTMNMFLLSILMILLF